MNINNRLEAFIQLGKTLKNIDDETFERISWKAANTNNWFTQSNIRTALDGITYMLEEKTLREWLSRYDFEHINTKKVGVIMAGNIPFAGFHDMLCVLMAGHELHTKLNAQDPILPKFIAEQLIDINPEFKSRIYFQERLNIAEAIIATPTNNSSRYFHQYFAKIPHIIRQNRSSVGILKGSETKEDFKLLGDDIFHYFGLGDRSISKLYVPAGFDFQHFFEAVESRSSIRDHHKYNNNYDYNKSIYLVNAVPHLDNGFLLLKEDKTLVSPISVLFYESYQDEGDLALKLQDYKAKIQIIVSKEKWYPQSLQFGESQKSKPWVYNDGIDTMAFLSNL